MSWYNALPPRDVVVFTDGSQEGNKIDYGFVIYQKRRLLATQTVSGWRREPRLWNVC